MSLGRPSNSTPPDLDLILAQIAKAHESPDDESLTESAIIASVDYLQQLPPEFHWLCSSHQLLPVVAQAAQLWGYSEPPALATLAKFKLFLERALSQCAQCAVEWHVSLRRELRRVFREIYSYDEFSTAGFYLVLDKWDQQRLLKALRYAIDNAEKLPTAWKRIEIKAPFVEAIADPNLLLKNEILELWRELFSHLQPLPPDVGDTSLPGALVLLFDSEPRISTFAEQLFKKRKEKVGSVEFDEIFRKPLAELIKRQSEKVLAGCSPVNIR